MHRVIPVVLAQPSAFGFAVAAHAMQHGHDRAALIAVTFATVMLALLRVRS